MLNETNKKPEIIVFAGPNGSGKSTITRMLRPGNMPYVNADEIQRVLECEPLEAAQIAEGRREDYVKAKKSFSFETVLSTDRNLNLLKKAKEAGYFIRCFYVVTVSPEINVARVRARVAAGGHDVPIEKIYSRYDNALALVPEVVAVCDVCHIYDNSSDRPFRIFKKRKDLCWYSTKANYWRKEDIALLTGVSDATRANLNMR